MKSSTTIDRLHTLELQERDFLRIGAAYQQLFWENGQLPTVEVVHNFLGEMYTLERIREYVETDEFQEKLGRLGLLTDTISQSALTPEQLVVANAELNFLDKRSIRDKLNEINEATGLKITTTMYQGWNRDPAYISYRAKRAEQLFKELDAEAYIALTKAVKSGDMKAVEMVFTMKGKYAKNVNINFNIEVILLKFVEIVTRHVTDEASLLAIAEEVEQLKSRELNASL